QEEPRGDGQALQAQEAPLSRALAGRDLLQLPDHVTLDRTVAGEHPRRPPDPGPDPADEVPLDALADGVGPAVFPEAVQIEAEALRALPEVRVVNASALCVERVAHLPEGPLPPSGLSRCVQGWSARVLGGHREVAEAEPQRQLSQPRPARGAVGTAEVGVDD